MQPFIIRLPPSLADLKGREYLATPVNEYNQSFLLLRPRSIILCKCTADIHRHALVPDGDHAIASLSLTTATSYNKITETLTFDDWNDTNIQYSPGGVREVWISLYQNQYSSSRRIEQARKRLQKSGPVEQGHKRQNL